MTFGIIIRGKNQPSQSKRFHPHHNAATGKYHHTKKDYLAELKRQDLVPYEKPKPRKDAEYKPSKWAHEMVNEIQRTDGNPKSAWYAQLEKKGITDKTLRTMKENAKRVDGKTEGGITSD